MGKPITWVNRREEGKEHVSAEWSEGTSNKPTYKAQYSDCPQKVSVKDEKSSSSCLAEPNKTSLEEREEERFKRREEGRKFYIQSHFPIRELKPLEFWCTASLIYKVASQISVFSRSVFLYLSPLVSHCPSSAVCLPSLCLFLPHTPLHNSAQNKPTMYHSSVSAYV